MLQRWLGSRASLVRIALAGALVFALAAVLAAVASRTPGVTSLSGALSAWQQFQVHNSSHNGVWTSFVGAPLHVWLNVGPGAFDVYRWNSTNCFGSPTGYYHQLTTGGQIEDLLPTTPTAVSVVSFRAISYPTGSLPQSYQHSPCWNVTVSKSTPTITTTLHDEQHATRVWATVGLRIHPRIEVNGPGGPASGSIFVAYYPNGTCTAAAGSSGGVTATLSAGVADMTQLVVAPRTDGTHSFYVEFPARNNDPAYTGKAICWAFSVK